MSSQINNSQDGGTLYLSIHVAFKVQGNEQLDIATVWLTCLNTIIWAGLVIPVLKIECLIRVVKVLFQIMLSVVCECCVGMHLSNCVKICCACVYRSCYESDRDGEDC